jgi:hypothetical protein
MIKKSAPYLIFFIIVIAMVWVRVYTGAGAHYKTGQAALDNADLPAAVHSFDRAIHMYSPGAGAIKKSIAGLQIVAGKFHDAGDLEGELYAWRILRSALYSIRHVRLPHRDVIGLCDDKIATLMALQKGEPNTEAFLQERELRYKELTKTVGPKTGYALLAEFGFFGWVVFALLFIWKGIRPDKGFNKKPAVIFLALFIAGYALWLLGLAKA